MSIYSASVDDTDSRIIYSAGWEAITSDPFSNWQGTLHSTSLFGTFAFFKFTGSAVAVRCTIPSGAAEQSRVSFSIDDGPARIISQETSPSSQWQHVFWESGTLEMGPHVLLITNLVDGDSLHLDSIDYEPETLPRISPASTTTSVVIMNQAKTSAFVTQTTRGRFSAFETTSTSIMLTHTPTFSNPTFSAATSTISSESPSFVSMTEGPTIQVLGGVFVGVLFICFFVCLAFVLVRRRKRMADVTFPDDLCFLPTVHKNISKSPNRSFPKEPEFLFSPPLGRLSFQTSNYDFREGALRNITFQSNHIRPLEPLHGFPAYRPAERRPQIAEGVRRPPLPPMARHSPKRFSLAHDLRKATVARPHPFYAAVLREPSTVHLAREFR